MRQKRIALIIYSLHEGGAERVTAELSVYFAQLHHQVAVIVFDGSHKVYEHGGELIDLQLPSAARSSLVLRLQNLLRRAWRLRRLFRQQPFDLIIAVMESAGFASTLSSRDTIIANHCNPEKSFSGTEWWLARRLFPRARRVVAVSRQGQAIFRRRMGLTNVQTIYNPVAIQRIQKAAQETSTPALTGKPYLLAVGRLEAVKRFDLLLAAYARSDARNNFDLIILGQGSLYNNLQQQLQQLGLEERVLLAGHVTNPYPYLSQARFTVLSSDHEGFPMVLIESLCLGRPVIATDCPTGPDEIIRHEQNGLLVPVGDVEALSAAIDRLINDQTLYRHLSSNAVASVQDLEMSLIAEQWLQLCKPVTTV